ncbi:MAG: DUF1294 domain-containing protein [Anaerolineae bacterium]|nr:DUF1294 domain-containing protein [Anaerolineae bacterium]
MYKRHRYQINGILFGLLILCALIGVLLFTTTWSFYWIWMIAINITTFILFGVDKGLAKSLKTLRIPEIVLHIYTILGGVVGQAAGRLLFRHKISRDKKRPFNIALVLGILLQIGLIYLLFFR